jgi:hypothetical protein
MEKQPECCAPNCPSLKKYGSRKIQCDWNYFYCPKGGEAYCLKELGREGIIKSDWTCPTHNVKLFKRHYPMQVWDEK